MFDPDNDKYFIILSIVIIIAICITTAGESDND